MKAICTTLLLFALVLLHACGVETKPQQPPPAAATLPPTPPTDTHLESFLSNYEQYFLDAMSATGTPGAAVVVVKDSQVVYLRGFGLRDAGGRQPVDGHTVFRIGSLSKGFAAVLTGVLVAEGSLDWHQKVQTCLPGFTLRDPAQADRLEIRHLLSQTTGLPYHAFSNLIEEGFDLQAIMEYFPQALAGKEGAFFSYQNAAFCLIEPIVESSLGKTYQQVLAEKIFQPLGMNSASCDFDGIQNCGNKALPHTPTERGWVADSITHRYYNFAAAGGVNASAADMGEWLKALLGHKPEVVPGATLDQVFTPVIGTGLERPVLRGFIDRDSAAYALGWRVLQRWPDTLVYHAGFVNNFHSEIALNRADGIGVCVMFNSPSPLAGECIFEFFKRWEESGVCP